MQEGDRWQKLGDLFDAAVDLPGDQQRAFLDQACAGEDADLRLELEQMLGLAPAASAVGERLQAAIGAAASQLSQHGAHHDPLIGQFLGPYRIDALIGRGGMGAVYRAFREDDQFRKEVAIKVIPRVLAGPGAVARFRAERQILANLEHPNIARLIDGGASEGVPYLVMEYVEGFPITRYASEKNLPTAERLRLMRTVCSAVQYAHSKLVVHRDLKPANILVSSDGMVKLLDFGVAKMMEPGSTTADVAAAHTAAMMMTPDYASPEQVRGEPASTSSDVYSLGIVLYELLTGERPYRVTGTSPLEMERLICHTEPRRPSEVEMLPRKLRRSLSGDLDNIVLMALRKDADRRYPTAEQLSEDLRRYLDGQPVQARPDTVWYRTGKFLQRNRWAVAAGVLVAASMIAATAVSIRQARVAKNRFDQFRGFARTVLVDLHGQLNDIPGTARARQALIAHVSDYLKRVVADNAEDDTALASEIATTYLRLGELQGVTREALASYESGRRLLESKRQKGSATGDDLLALARLQLRIGTTQAELGDTGKALADWLAAYTLAGEAAKQGGAKVETLKVQARAYWRVARAYRVQYRLQEAEEHARIAVTACEELLKQHGLTQDRELDEIHSGARMVLAGVLRRQGKWEPSLELYRAVLSDIERRAAQNPGSAGLQRELARTHQIMGDMLSRLPGREQDTLQHARAAIAIAERLVAADPQDKTSLSELAQYLSSGHEALSGYETTHEEGEGYLRRALPIFLGLLEREPGSGNLMLYTALTEAELGDSMGRKGPSAESIRRIRSGLARLQTLLDREPGDLTTRIELFKLQRMLARNLARAGEAGEAMRVSKDLIDAARGLSESPASSAKSELPMRELPRAYAAMGEVCRLLHRDGEARQAYQKAVDAWAALRGKGFTLPDAADEIARAVRQAKQ